MQVECDLTPIELRMFKTNKWTPKRKRELLGELEHLPCRGTGNMDEWCFDCPFLKKKPTFGKWFC